MAELEWRTVKGFPNFEVSSDGNVRCVDQTEFELRQSWYDGSYWVDIATDGKRKRRQTFVLDVAVAQSFVPNENPSQWVYVIHLDGSAANNAPSNLQWGNWWDKQALRGFGKPTGTPIESWRRQVLAYIMWQRTGSEVWLEKSIAKDLRDLIHGGEYRAKRLDPVIANLYAIPLRKATSIRTKLGFKPAYKGGRVVAPKCDVAS